MKIKALALNERFYYLFPEGIKNLDEFVAQYKDSFDAFIPLQRLVDDNCVHPYYVREDIKSCFLRVSSFNMLTEGEVEILTREEYDQRLVKIMRVKCVDCAHYTEDLTGDNLKGHREKMRLDGVCYAYERESL